MIGGLIVLIILFGIYFLPTIGAVLRKKKQKNAIFLLNFFLGWTFIGWVIALVWAGMED